GVGGGVATDAKDWDSPWKEALDRYLEPALRLLFPAAHAGIDWSRGWQPLDGELQQVLREGELGRRVTDKLFRVHRRAGGEVWIALHVEVQGYVDETLPARIRLYRYRIHDRYGVPVASLVVLTDDRAEWRPGPFEEEVLGCRERVEFPATKLLDFEDRRDALLADPNPFALVVLVHLEALRTRRHPERRLHSKRRLVRALYERGGERKDVLALLRFLDWLLDLPPPQEAIFDEYLVRLEQEKNMPYRMKFEVEAEARGEEKGQRAAILAVLRARFAPLPPDLPERLEAVAGAEQLDRLAARAATATSLDDVLRDLERPSGPT
ncbi:MAG: transposase, partial [Planctomycetota bacterium]|nr:transposase [Planctomycetota bacterium]